MASAPRSYHFTFGAPGPWPSRLLLLKNTLLLLSGAAAAATYAAYMRRRQRRKNISPTSALTDAAVGASVLESRAAVDQLLAFHYGRPQDILPALFSSEKLQEAVNFPQQLGILVERYCPALRDFTGDSGEPTALDVGCGVGGVSFELAHSFSHVVGIDASKACINAAKTMKERGWMRYSSIEEGDLTLECTAIVPEGTDPERVNFAVADPGSLPSSVAVAYDAVVAANVLCRLENPSKLLQKLPSLVRHGGIAVLASPYDWLETCTPRAQWLGGFKDAAGVEVRTVDGLKKHLGADFELVAETDLPLVVKENSRRYHLSVSHVTVWKRL